MKNLLKVSLIVSFIFSGAVASAATSIDQMWKLFHEYELQLKTIGPKQNAPAEVTKPALDDEALAIASEASELYPEKFNEFLLQALDRYDQFPEERPAIGTLLKAIGDFLDNEFDVEKSTTQFTPLLVGSTEYAAVLLMLRSPVRWLLVSKTPALAGSKFAKALTSMPGNVFSKVRVKNEVLQRIGTAVVGGIGYAEILYLLDESRTHRWDPRPALNLVQYHVGCNVVIAARDENKDLQKLGNLKIQAELLAEQNTDLERINKDSDRMQLTISTAPGVVVQKYPVNCEQISLLNMARMVSEKMRALIPAAPPENQNPPPSLGAKP